MSGSVVPDRRAGTSAAVVAVPPSGVVVARSAVRPVVRRRWTITGPLPAACAPSLGAVVPFPALPR